MNGGKPIGHWTLHDLRRSVVTGLNELGIAPHYIEAVVNHISGARGGIAGVYNLAKYAEPKREALIRWGRHIEEVWSTARLAVSPAMSFRSSPRREPVAMRTGPVPQAHRQAGHRPTG